METDKPRFPKKAFLSRARSSSTSIASSSASSTDLTINGSGRTYSGLDLLAEGSEMLANRQLKDLTDASGSFSKRSRDDSLSYASLPDEMKVSFSELEDTGITLDDLNFNACPQMIEDAAPSNVTLDLTPKPDPDDLVENETEILPLNQGVSSTSCLDDYKTSDSYHRVAQNIDRFGGKDPRGCDSSNKVDISNTVPRTETENQSSVITSNFTGTQESRSGSSTGTSKVKKSGGTGNHSAGSGIGSLIQASSGAGNENQSWDTVTELPWADDRLMEEISQVCSFV